MNALQLVIGPRAYLDATRKLDGTETVAIVDIPAAAHSTIEIRGGFVNTLVITWDSDEESRISVGPANKENDSAVTLPWNSLFARMLPGRDLRKLFKLWNSDEADIVPLFAFAPVKNNAGEDAVHVFGRIRFGDNDALFIRLTEEPVPQRMDRNTWPTLEAAASLHRGRALFLNNHQCYYLRMFQGEELEHKYVVDPALDIWATTVELYNALRDGELPNYVMEYGDEFQTWDYMNHLFEVPGPPDEQGYISFIPLSTGGYTIKRKWFSEDATRRGEKHIREPLEVDDFSAYIGKRFGVETIAHPPFRRVRYDVNFESLATGHVYGIFFDHSRLLAEPTVALAQCELEYLRTRSILEVSEADVLCELEEIAVWLESFFKDKRIATSRGVYSKLSFLRDSVEANPKLASIES